MSDSRTVLPAPKLLNLVGIRADANAAITLGREDFIPRGPLPCVREAIRKSPLSDTRTLANLPWQGVPGTIRLRFRRFFCNQKACDRAIFAERLPGVAAHYGRRTARLESWFSRTSPSLSGVERVLAF